jgi:L-ascorbate 6-phosphate lactonase
MNALQTLQSIRLQDKQMAVSWLGQAGFLFRTASERYAVIDPYLSNYCEETLGPAFKRLMPTVLQPEELDQLSVEGLDAYIMTHHHEDHLDPPTIRALESTKHRYYAPPSCLGLLDELGVDRERCSTLKPGTRHQWGEMSLTATFADHGELAPDAVGILIEFGGKVVFHMGDTCLREEELEKIRARTAIDLLIAPINGKYGNMNERDAARAVSILRPSKVIPCHFWMLPANSGGDPVKFMELVKERGTGCETVLLTQGEAVLI